MDLAVLAVVFGAIFVVELPDKTFIATLVLATKFRPIYVWIGVGLAFTVLLDVLLIPRYGVMGAAFASTTAYLLTDAALLVMLRRAGGHTAEELREVPTPPERVRT